MPLYKMLFFLYACAVAATPLQSTNVCVLESAMINGLHSYPAASSFCSTFLGIKTSTLTTISTVTPSPVVLTSPKTDTASPVLTTSTLSAKITVTSGTPYIITPTSTATFTSTRTAVISCVSTAATVTLPNLAKKDALKPSSTTSGTSRLTLSTSHLPSQSSFSSLSSTGKSTTILASTSCTIPVALQTWASSALSTACSCLSLPTPSTTITSTTTIAPAISTSIALTTITPTTTIFTTITSTITDVTTFTSTADATTITITSTTTSSILQPTGLAYYYFETEGFGADYSNIPNIVASLSGNSSYQYSGVVQNVNTIYSDSGEYLTLPDSSTTVPGAFFAFIFQGYLYAAASAGSYTISSNIDDTGLVWLGPSKAYGTLWNYNNADYVCELPCSTSTTVELAAGEVYPITLFFGNSGGPARADFKITTPDGMVHSDTTPFFVGACAGTALFEP